MKKLIYVTDTFEGIHHWPQAPEIVSFLRHPHRHLFHVKVTAEVKEDDREIEFFIFKEAVQQVIQTLGMALTLSPTFSCERMALFILTALKTDYPTTKSVEVSEDSENGAIVEI